LEHLEFEKYELVVVQFSLLRNMSLLSRPRVALVWRQCSSSVGCAKLDNHIDKAEEVKTILKFGQQPMELSSGKRNMSRTSVATFDFQSMSCAIVG
jgi:hypothetical protein